MLIAKKTKETNIAEHVIYMFQIEDLIRANHLEVETIMQTIIKPQIKDEQLLAQYQQWYLQLVKQMKNEGIESKGHFSEINEILMELLLLHDTLLSIMDDQKYKAIFEKAMPVLKDFQHKSQSTDINLVEVAFNAMYSKLILKLKGQAFTQATEDAFKTISDMLAYLAATYKKMKKGELN